MPKTYTNPPDDDIIKDLLKTRFCLIYIFSGYNTQAIFSLLIVSKDYFSVMIMHVAS